MYPGGRIIHFVENNSLGPRPLCSDRTFSVVWADRDNMQNIQVAGRMIGAM